MRVAFVVIRVFLTERWLMMSSGEDERCPNLDVEIVSTMYVYPSISVPGPRKRAIRRVSVSVRSPSRRMAPWT
jgi:hypothetical protein